MTEQEKWTIGRLLNWTTDFLRDKGGESPRLDAEVLLAHARGCQRIELYTAFEEEAAEPLRESFRDLVRRRAAGTPVAYLVGHREFFSMPFEVTSDVLIPRPETELIVVRVLDLAKSLNPESPSNGDLLRIADVGTGSGILAVCCAKHLPNSLVTAIDLSANALAVAQTNAQQHEVAGRIEFYESDLFEAVASEDMFNVIVSNPPYVASLEMDQLDPCVREYEPHLALDGGQQGSDIIARLIPQAAQRLQPGGWLLMEVGPYNADKVESLINQCEQLSLQVTIPDLAGHPRVVQAQRK